MVLAALLPAEPPRTLVLDNAGLFLGEVVDACRAWSSGRLPEWSDSLWAGFPLLGDPAVGALYPPNLIACLLTPPWHIRLFDVLAAIHLGLLVAGTVYLLRLLELGLTAAVLGGLLALLWPAPHFSGVAYMPVLGCHRLVAVGLRGGRAACPPRQSDTRRSHAPRLGRPGRSSAGRRAGAGRVWCVARGLMARKCVARGSASARG